MSRNAFDAIERQLNEAENYREIVRHEREMEAQRRDAERYRYFKKCFDSPAQRYELARRLGCRDAEFEPSLDVAIDEAMKEQK